MAFAKPPYEFEEFFRSLEDRVVIALHLIETFLERSPLLKKLFFTFLENLPFDDPIHVRVGETGQALIELGNSQLEPASHLFPARYRSAIAPFEFDDQIVQFLRCHPDSRKRGTHLGEEQGLRNTGSSTRRSMAPVVCGAFLSLPDEGVAATPAAQGFAVGEVVLQALNLLPPAQDILYFAEEPSRNEGLMLAEEVFAGTLDTDDPDVELVMEKRREAVQAHAAVPAITKAQAIELVIEQQEVVATGGVQFKGPSHQGRRDGIGGLDLSATVITIPDRCWQGIVALLETSVEALYHFIAEIADVVGSDDGLDVCRESSAT